MKPNNFSLLLYNLGVFELVVIHCLRENTFQDFKDILTQIKYNIHAFGKVKQNLLIMSVFNS